MSGPRDAIPTCFTMHEENLFKRLPCSRLSVHARHTPADAPRGFKAYYSLACRLRKEQPMAPRWRREPDETERATRSCPCLSLTEKIKIVEAHAPEYM